jgi:hypothetical protein
MKKLVLVLALALLAVPAFADDAKEILLTSDGTLFVAEQRSSQEYPELQSSTTASVISLTVRRGEESKKIIVPGTLASGTHKNPALAYDDASKTLFIFWQRSASLLHSELLFETMNSNFEFGPTAAFGNGQNYRENLSIAVTRKADAPDAEGTSTTAVPQINVHAVWWETDSWDGQQSAQYAMLTVENGVVVETSIHSLLDFVDAQAAETRFVTNSIPEVYKHPSLFPSAQQDSILVIFGELRDESFNRVRIRPAKIVGQARVHIPVGRAEGKSGAPRMNLATNAHVGVLVGGDNRVAVYGSDGQKLRYTLFKDGQWSEERSIQIDDAISSDATIGAVRRLIDRE